MNVLIWLFSGWACCALADDQTAAPASRPSETAVASQSVVNSTPKSDRTAISKLAEDSNPKSAKSGQFKQGDWPFHPLSRPDIPKLT
ncbi:MAG TPA: hypothetical protein VGJ04_12365, partial [Pirellulales bacterium]